MEYTPADGYLLLADISGYTKFLAGPELDHGHAIVRELTSLVRHALVPPLRFVKFEGDAVFCYATDATFRDGERLVELLGACYFAFTNRLDDMRRSTTCTCRACASVGALDLKFLAHHGTFVVDLDEDGREDVAGRDVIVVHRLLKNTVSETGIDVGYAFLTSPCLEQLPQALSLETRSETYDGIGTGSGGVHDLRPAVVAMREARRERLTSDEADFETVGELAAAPAVVWQYVVDAVERQRWVCPEMNDQPDEMTPNREGRIGPGATMHCNHGPGAWLREFVDWRPFEYFTSRAVASGAGAAESRAVIAARSRRRARSEWATGVTARHHLGRHPRRQVVRVAEHDHTTHNDQQNPNDEHAAVEAGRCSGLHATHRPLTPSRRWRTPLRRSSR